MELTSDINQHNGAGDEIDIDLDLTGENPQDREDEFMGEEDMNALADSTSVDRDEFRAANDDEMADDSYAQGQADEGSSVRDEDIEDAEYTGPEIDEDTIVEPDKENLSEQSDDLLANYEEIIRDQNPEQDYQDCNEQEPLQHPATPETESCFIERQLPNGQTGQVNPGHNIAEVATGETSNGYDVEVSKEGKTVADQASEFSDVDGLIAPEAKLEQVEEDFLPASLGQEIVVPSNVEGSHIQEEDPPNRLHPVVLDYQGEEMFLFPPVDQIGEHAATFLLEDEQLAYSTIGNVLEACRGVVKESLREQEELVINIHDLDLHISESTIESASIRLSEIVDLYVRLQQNDGLENPPPLYMDLISSDRFSRRLDVLRNALIEGKGLSQLKSSQEDKDDQHHRTEGETYPLYHTALLSSNETYAPEQQPGDEAEESIYQYDSHSDRRPPENILLGTGSATQGTGSYYTAVVANEDHERMESQLGTDNKPHEAGVRDDSFSEAVVPKQSLEPLQSFAGEAEVQKAEESIVDDGDFIDYEDVEEIAGGTSSASSTLQGDAIDVNAVQDHLVPEEPIYAENQEHRSPDGVQNNAAADEEIVHEFVDEKDTSDVGIIVEEEQPNLADILSQASDDKGQHLSGLLNEDGEATGNDQNARISQATELGPQVNADDDQHEAASVQYEDDAESYLHDTSDEQAAQAQGDAYPVADTTLKGEIEDYSPTHPSQTESSRSGRGCRDDDQGRVKDIEVENELEEADRSLANDDNDHVPQTPNGVNTRPSFFVQESAQTQEDDDEITYEDEEPGTEFPHEPAKAEHNGSTSPGSLKRARNLDEEDDALEEDFQGAKRVRSG